MRNKIIVFGGLVVMAFLVALLFFYPLSPFGALAEEPCDPSTTGGICPVPPLIGSIANITVQTTQSAGTEPYNINKMGASGQVFFDVLDDQGNPYFSSYTYIVNGKLVPVQMNFTLDLEKGDGVALPSYPLILSGSSPLTLAVQSFYIRNKPCYEPSFPCSPEEKSLTFYANPLTPGPVYLKRLVIDIVTADQNATIVATNSYSTRTKLFTIGDPPRITSVNKTAAKIDETITVTGTNFDAYNATSNQWADQIHFDVAPANNAGGYGQSRVISWVGDWWEDRVHYCGATKLKFDWPPDILVTPSSSSSVYTYLPMPTGAHTITLVNDFGWSNPVTINFTGGQGTPENDPACRNEPGSISAITPTAGPVGTEVTIDGTGFLIGPTPYRGDISDNAITFGGGRADNSYVTGFKYERYINPETGLPAYNGTQIRVRVPPGAKTGPVTVKPGGKYTIWGPVFTVTGGQVSPSPTPTPGGGAGTSGAELAVSGIFPDSINIGVQNTILIHGSGFTSAADLTSEEPAIEINDIQTNEEGTLLRAEVNVAATEAESARFVVSDGENEDSVEIALEELRPGAPVIASAEVSEIDQKNQASLFLTGENLDSSTTVEVDGIQARVTGITRATGDSLEAKLEFSVFYSKSDGGGFKLVNTAQAIPLFAGVNPGVVRAQNGQGSATASVNAPQPAAAAFRISTKPLSIEFQLKNPLKGGAKSLTELIGIVANFIFNLGIPVAVIVIIYGGFLMLTSGGKPEAYKKGLDALKYAVLGVAILLIGQGFVSLIQSILGIKK